MTDRRRLFTFLLPEREVCEEKNLYYRDGGKVRLQDGVLFLPAEESVSFDCYFNLFDYAAVRDYTPIENLIYRLSLQGEMTLSLSLLRLGKKEKDYQTIPLSEVTFSAKERTEFDFPLSLSALSEKGSIFLTLRATADSRFYGGYIQSDREPLREVKIGVAITTFKRESFVKSNVKRLTRDLPSEIFSLFVADNGNTLSQGDVAGATLLPNINLGGSGGFTRCILEIQKAGGFTHVLLTDDDIAFESEIFLRTAAILRYLTDPDRVIVGASMLLRDKPYLQNELGAIWTGRRQDPNNFYLDLTDPLSLAKNADHPDADYSSWWFNCFPLTLSKRVGLPFPFFIKMDDTEYCIRSGCDLLLLNGIGVWHERFETKFSSANEYYHARNSLILNAIHFPHCGGLYHFVNLLRAVAKQLLFQRYRTLDLVFRAFDDFLQGADAFRRIDGESLHHDLATQGESFFTREELESQGFDLSDPIVCPQEERNKFGFKQLLTLNGYLLPAEKRPYRVIDSSAVAPVSFYRARQAVQYDPINERGFVTRQDRGVLIRTGFKLIRYLFKLVFHYRKAARSFRKYFPEIVSEAAWKERLSLPRD